MAFAQLGPVGAEDDGQMTVIGGSHAEGLVEEQVPGCARKPLLRPQHMGYFHQVVIDHVGHVVGREPVCLDEHEVTEFVRLEGDLIAYAVVEGYGPGLGDAEPDDRNVGVSPGLGLLLRYVPASTIVARVLLMLRLLVPHGFQALRRAVAMVGCTTVKQLLCVAVVDLQSLGL